MSSLYFHWGMNANVTAVSTLFIILILFLKLFADSIINFLSL